MSKYSKKANRKPKYFLRVILWGILLALFLMIADPAILPFLPEGFRQALDSTRSSLFGDIGSVITTVTINWNVILKLVAAILLLLLISSLIRFILDHIHPSSGKGKSGVTLARSAVSYLTALIGLFWSLSILGVGVGTILASVGIVTLVVGLGAETLIADMLSGLFLVFEEQFNVGDIIEVAGFRGTVESIGIRTTAIRDAGGNLKLINNADVRNVLNRSSSASVASVTVSISYSENLERVENLLANLLPEIQQKYPQVFLSAPVYRGVQELGSSAVELKITAEVREQEIFAAPRLLNREIKLAFDSHGVEIPFAQLVVHNGDKA